MGRKKCKLKDDWTKEPKVPRINLGKSSSKKESGNIFSTKSNSNDASGDESEKEGESLEHYDCIYTKHIK